MSITTELVETGAKRDGRGRRIATREEKIALIAQYRGSGLTQRAFAEREGVKFSTFTAWLQVSGSSGTSLTVGNGDQSARGYDDGSIAVVAILAGATTRPAS